MTNKDGVKTPTSICGKKVKDCQCHVSCRLGTDSYQYTIGSYPLPAPVTHGFATHRLASGPFYIKVQNGAFHHAKDGREMECLVDVMNQDTNNEDKMEGPSCKV